MSSTVPQIDNGKTPTEHLHALHMLPLPAGTPFGNLTLKFMGILMRMDRVNLAIDQVYRSYGAGKVDLMNASLHSHVLQIEEVIYWLRKTADELIALVYLLSERKKTGTYPKVIKPDSIGQLLDDLKRNAPHAAVAPHIQFLRQLNEISNAYKHSFINSDINVIGRDEPCVFALGLKGNNLESKEQLYGVTLRSVVEGFSQFYASIKQELKKCQIPQEALAPERAKPGATS